MKRVVLFLVTNLAIIVMVSIIMSILGVTTQTMGGLLIFAFLIGMGGSFLSLAMSKKMAKWTTGAEIIESPRNDTERWLMETVERQAKDSGIGMPEVAIYDGEEMNAFATGMNRNNALVAVSTGLMHGMTKDEVEAVLAHEVSHVANGDMVTMALLQGILNTFVVFLARIIGGAVDSAMSSDDEESESEGPGITYFVVSIIAEIILGILASIITMWFSRHREYRADAGAARLVGADKMVRALQRLQMGDEVSLPAGMSAMGISGSPNGIMALFSSHPPLEERISALQNSFQA